MSSDDLTEFFGKPIFSYTSEQAVEDGNLIYPYPDRWPWLLITPGVHAACEADDQRTYEQKLVPLLQDCIMLAKDKKLSSENSPLTLEHTVAGTVWIGLNERGGFTVMTPDEY